MKRLVNIFLAAIVVAMAVLPVLPAGVALADGESWLSGFDYRKSISINGTAGSSTNYTIKLEIHSEAGSDNGSIVYLDGHSLNFPDDIRFTDNDGSTELYYAINPAATNNATTVNFIVKVTDNLDSNQAIYIYYGSAGAETTSDLENTLIFGDNFDREPVNSLGAVHLPSPVQMPNGDLLIAVRDGNAVKIRQSTDLGANWTALSTVWANTGSASEVQLYLLDSGDLMVSTWYSTNATLVAQKSSDSGVTWGSNAPDYNNGNDISIYALGVGASASEPDFLELIGGDILVSFTYNPGDSELDTLVAKSSDSGGSWAAPSTVLTGNATFHHEDSSLVQLSTGRIILAAEREYTEGGYSQIVGIMSTDNGTTWGSNSPAFNDGIPNTIIDPGANVDEEGGSFLYIADNDVRYVFSNDENDEQGYRSYTWANIKQLTTTDGGETWGSKRTVYDSMLTGQGGYNFQPLLLANGDIYVFGERGDASGSYWVKDSLRNIPTWLTTYNNNRVLLTDGHVESTASPSMIVKDVNNSDNFSVEYRFQSNGAGYLSISANETPSTYLWQMVNTDNRYDLRDGTTVIINVDWAPDLVEHTGEYNKTSADVFTNYLDGVQMGSNATATASQLTHIGLFFFDTPSFEVGGVLVRKYNSPEPTILSYGLEETATFTISTLAVPIISMDKDGTTSGNLSANITSLAGASLDGWFEYWITGQASQMTANVSYSTTGVIYVAVPANLTPGVTYNVRFNATNAGGTTTGNTVTFTLTTPSVTTGASTVTANQVTLNGNISSMGVASSTYVYFEYGTTAAYGSSTALVTQSGTGAFAATITTPSSDTTLYYRAVAQNGAVLAYGSGASTSVPSATGGLILKLLLRVALAAVIIAGVAIVGLQGGTYALFLAGVVGLLAYSIIDSVINTLF